MADAVMPCTATATRLPVPHWSTRSSPPSTGTSSSRSCIFLPSPVSAVMAGTAHIYHSLSAMTMTAVCQLDHKADRQTMPCWTLTGMPGKTRLGGKRAMSAALSYSSGESATPLLGDTIGGNFDATAVRFSGREALVDRTTGRRLTYAELAAD